MISFTKKMLLLFLATSLVACSFNQQEITPDQLSTETAKLTVACFISPQDTLLTAKVSRSRPVLDNNAAQAVDIANASVTLSNGSTTVNLIYNASQSQYTIKAKRMPIQAGSTYILTVSTPDGKQVTATTTVPTQIPLKNIRIDSTSQSTAAQKVFRAIGCWDNQSGAYFRLKGMVQGISQTAPLTASYGTPSPISFMSATNSMGLLTCGRQDKSLAMAATLGDGSFKKNNRSTLISVSLLHVDEAYYHYHLALNQQLQASENPFAESVTIPSNIQGGLGCFGSYNLSPLAVTIR
ncbi:hypothetical protein GCM10028805_49290 [Spirosoma harenae]